jgi:hypothetical protein
MRVLAELQELDGPHVGLSAKGFAVPLVQIARLQWDVSLGIDELYSPVCVIAHQKLDALCLLRSGTGARLLRHRLPGCNRHRGERKKQLQDDMRRALRFHSLLRLKKH